MVMPCLNAEGLHAEGLHAEGLHAEGLHAEAICLFAPHIDATFINILIHMRFSTDSADLDEAEDHEITD